MMVSCAQCNEKYDMIEHLIMLNIMGKKVKKNNAICSECMKKNIYKKLEEDEEMKRITWAIEQLERVQRNEIQKEAFDLVADLGHKLISINDVEEIIDIDRLYIMSGLLTYVEDQIEEVLRFHEEMPDALDDKEEREQLKSMFAQMKKLKQDYSEIVTRTRNLTVIWRKFMLR